MKWKTRGALAAAAKALGVALSVKATEDGDEGDDRDNEEDDEESAAPKKRGRNARAGPETKKTDLLHHLRRRLDRGHPNVSVKLGGFRFFANAYHNYCLVSSSSVPV